MSTFMYRFPPMREEVLANGLRVIWIADAEQAAMTVALQLPFGKFSDPAGFEGLTELTAGLMQKGTVNTPYEEFTEQFEHTGSSLFSEVGDEYVVLGCKLLSRHAPVIIPGFWDMVTAPALREGELKLLRKEFITGIKADSTEPSGVADRHFHMQLFGTDHPAGRTHSEKSVGRVTHAAVSRHCRSYISPRNATMVIAGDFDLDAAVRTWGPLFAGWDGSSPARDTATEAPPSPGTGRIRFIEKPDLTQATIMIGKVMPGELYKQRGEVALANYILGGGNFSSRLMSEIRSKIGKTYSISSQLSALRRFGTLVIGTSTQNAQAGDMIGSILQVYRQFHDDGVSAEEVDKARQFILGNMAFQFEGIGNVAEKVLWLRFHGRDNAYIDQYVAAMKAIRREDINREIREHFDPAKLVFTVVGRKDQILPQLHRFGTVETRHYRSMSGG